MRCASLAALTLPRGKQARGALQEPGSRAQQMANSSCRKRSPGLAESPLRAKRLPGSLGYQTLLEEDVESFWSYAKRGDREKNQPRDRIHWQETILLI
ncbi:unnamed protein product [Coccothraustes coccothraustes]